MRFAYIDSQGNEVEIPSEDALRLRVELGAIVADTQLYDGSVDRWAPAGEHDFFRRMRRDLDGGGPGPSAAAPTAGTFDVLESTPWATTAADEIGMAPDAARPAPHTEAPRTSPIVAESPPFDGAWRAPADAGASDPAPGYDPAATGGGPEVGIPAGTGVDGSSGADEVMDFSDFGVLDLDDEIPVAPRSTAPPPDNPERGWAPAASDAGAAPEDPWTMPGREPWPPPAESLAATPRVASTAAHPFDAEEATPEWLRNDPDFAEPETPEIGSHDPSEPVSNPSSDGPPASPAPAASIRRTPPKRTRSRTIPVGRIAAGLAAVVVVAGGAFWALNREGGAAEPEVVEIPLPVIAPSLRPVVRSVSAVAMEDWVGRLAALPFRESLPPGPNDAWLGGRYMASAGDFPDVRLYWEAVGRFTQIAQAREADFFDEALTAALDTVPLPEADRAAVLERTRAGFEAAAADREAVYGQLRAVAEASLTLHTFLEQNEANIDYEPADAGLSRDPVLEAVPITDSLGDEMWNLVAEITSALDAVGFLDQVTTEGLLGVFLAKLEAVPVR